ncbi:uncharacterized protein [Nicotiana sylvestris]|uniref:uncharacterized protein n=1 Tax=Nicotiana sylvestris TaxID=4096 RepID=UPI00388C7D1A
MAWSDGFLYLGWLGSAAPFVSCLEATEMVCCLETTSVADYLGTASVILSSGEEHKQKLLNEDDDVLSDVQTLNSLGATNDYLVLQYAPTMRIIVKIISGRTLKLMVESDYIVADVKVAIQEKEGIRFHKQFLIFEGRRLENTKTPADYEYNFNVL